MSAAILIREASAAGLVLAPTPEGSLSVRGPKAVRDRFRDRLADQKVIILAELASAEARVMALRESMAAENARRRDWWRQPDPGWREGRIEIRSALTGEVTTVIEFEPAGAPQ